MHVALTLIIACVSYAPDTVNVQLEETRKDIQDIIYNYLEKFLHLTQTFWKLLMKPSITSRHSSRPNTNIMYLRPPTPVRYFLYLTYNISLMMSY